MFSYSMLIVVYFFALGLSIGLGVLLGKRFTKPK